MVENAAVFINRSKRFGGVNVEVEDDSVVVKNRVSGAELCRYSIVEVAKEDMAYDVEDSGTVRRLVFQQGCGCSGIKSYKVDEGYSGALAG